MNKHTVVLTGAAGQDAFYLQQELVTKFPDIEILGLYRGQDEERLQKLTKEMPAVTFVRGDITDAASMNSLIENYQPFAVFNLAGVTSIPIALSAPYLTYKVNTEGVINILEAIRRHSPSTRLFQASTSEMYGNATDSSALDEQSRMVPTSPYGISKLMAHLACRTYRVSYGLHVSCAISFNHESPGHRPPIFVTRKVTQAAARIAAGKQQVLEMGNLAACRDWGFAGDYVKAFIKMVYADIADDYVVGTGKAHSVEDLVATAFSMADIDNWKDYVVVADSNLRPEDNNYLRANPLKIQQKLGWRAETTFEDLIKMMVVHDLELETGKPVLALG